MAKIAKNEKERKIGYKNPPLTGRPKGSKNKFTSLKDAFLNVFENMGGEDELLNWAQKSERNKVIFYGWITKMLPSNVDFTGKQKIEFRIVYDKEAKKE